MKRTKQRADRAGQAKPEHVSGCRQFEGEDLSKYILRDFALEVLRCRYKRREMTIMGNVSQYKQSP